jgi:ubiquinone/menaquinone biosynthesis C-methylase UbiE
MVRRIRRGIGLVVALGIIASSAGGRLGAQPTARQYETQRDTWQRVPEIFGAMGVAPGAVVADVGAGDGFLTTRLSHAVGAAGRVFAVDVSDRALERLRQRVQEEALMNVTFVKGDANDPHLAAASIDAAVIVNAYHEMVDHQAMLRQLRAALKPGGHLVIVEPISDKLLKDARELQVTKHEIAARFVEQETRDAGFRIQALQDPFVSRPNLIEWLILAVPDPNAPVRETTASAEPDETLLASADLRIPFDTFKQRRADGSIVVVDVRSEEEFAAGHIPAAIWIQLPDLSAHVEQLRALNKPIVTYCS